MIHVSAEDVVPAQRALHITIVRVHHHAIAQRVHVASIQQDGTAVQQVSEGEDGLALTPQQIVEGWQSLT